MCRPLFVIVFVLLLFRSNAVLAAPSPTTIGVYVNQIGSLDLKNNTFTVDFWIWFRSRGRDPSPIDSFEIVGGRILSKGTVVKKKLDNGEDYAAVRVNATIHRVWDLHRYPFDDHDLEVIIEETDLDALRAVFLPDTHNQGVDPNVTIAGWDVARTLDQSIAVHHYESNYGDLSIASAAEARYSRYTATIHAKRRGLARYLKVTFPLFIAVLVAYCAFFIRPKDAGPRVAVSVGAVFAAAAATVAINAQLPDVNYATWMDKTVFLSFGMIGLSLVGTVLALTLNYKNRDPLKIDRFFSLSFPALFALLLFWASRT